MNARTVHTAPATSRTFDSWRDMVEFSKSVPADGYPSRESLAKDPAPRWDWIAGRDTGMWPGAHQLPPAGFEQVRTWAQQTWEPGRKAVEDLRKQLVGKLKDVEVVNRRRRPRWSEDTGDDLDLDRLRSGQTYWRETWRAPTQGLQGRVRLITNISTSAHVDSKSILWRGAVALAAADILEEQGYRVEIIATECTTYSYVSGRGNWTVCTLKPFEAPLDVGTLATALSGWGFRTIWFDAKYHAGDHLAEGLGTPVEIGEWPKELKLRFADTGVTTWYVADVWDAAAAARELKGLLAGEPEKG